MVPLVRLEAKEGRPEGLQGGERVWGSLQAPRKLTFTFQIPCWLV